MDALRSPLSFESVLHALQDMLGQRVTVSVGSWQPPSNVATFSGELQRAVETPDGAIVFIVGESRPTQHFALRAETFERAFLGAENVGIVMAHNIHVQVSAGRFTALLEEQ